MAECAIQAALPLSGPHTRNSTKDSETFRMSLYCVSIAHLNIYRLITVGILIRQTSSVLSNH